MSLDDVTVIQSLVDRAYYEKQTATVFESDFDCALHYFNVGWKSGLNPNLWFSTRFYLDEHADVREAGINPFWHYIVVGQSEGRRVVDASTASFDVLDYLGQQRDFTVVGASWGAGCARGVERGWADIEPLIRDRRLVVSVSHDNYKVSRGGIQMVVGEEERLFSADGDIYLHVHPVRPRPHLALDSVDNERFQLTLNGEPFGWCSLKLFIRMSLERRIRKMPVSLIIHSFLGYSVNFLRTAIGVAEKVFFWIHDYSLFCQSWTLLRNNLAFCNHGGADHFQCDSCIHGNGRQHLNQALKPILRYSRITFVSPSRHALALAIAYARSSGFPIEGRSRLLPHRTYSVESRFVASPPMRRIAFLGYPVHHKGWTDFQRLSLRSELAAFCEFYVVCNGEVPATGNWRHVDLGRFQDAHNPMVEALRLLSIDTAFIGSLWPETFCLTAYEAVEAGCRLLVNANAGNPAEDPSIAAYRYCFESIDELVVQLGREACAELEFPIVSSAETSGYSHTLLAD